MFSFFSFCAKPNHFLALDIGGEAVKALIFRKEGAKRVILSASARHLDRFGVFDSRDFEQDVIKKAVSESIREAFQKIGQDFDKEIPEQKDNPFSLNLPGRIIKNKIVFQSFQRNNPKIPINNAEQEIIRAHVISGARKAVAEKFSAETGIIPPEILFFDFKFLDRKIDGYEVPDISGYEGKNLDFKILASFSPKYLFENYIKIVQDLHPGIPKIINEADDLISAATTLGQASVVYLDIGGHSTRIFAVKRGELQLVEDFYIGGECFTRSLSQDLGLNFQEARIMKEDYSNKILSEPVRKRVHGILAPSTAEWFVNLRTKLLRGQGLIAPIFYIFGGGSLLSDIKDSLETGDWGGGAFIADIKVNFLSIEYFHNIENRTGHLIGAEFIPLILNCSTHG